MILINAEKFTFQETLSNKSSKKTHTNKMSDDDEEMK